MPISYSILNKMSISMFLLSIPFAYITIGGIRVFPLLVFTAFLIILPTIKNIKFSNHMLIIVILNVLIFLGGIFTSDFLPFFSSIFFFILMYWPYLLQAKYFEKKVLLKFIKIYLNISIFMGFGVIFQYLAFNLWGVEIGKIDLMQERVGFGFIWTDYSFLSLYLASAIPLTFSIYKSKYISFILASILLISSILTTARTGFYALVIFLVIYVLNELIKKVFMLDKFSVKSFFRSFIYIFVIIIVCLYLVNEFPRLLSSSSSGRFEGYLAGLNYGINNIFFGSFYNPEYFKINAGVVPHNIFVYNFALGGGIFFIFFISWLILIIYSALICENKYLKYSIIIILFGMQFIPSVFSTYFFAILYSFIFYYQRLRETK